MYVIAVTGGIASGKSTVVDLFRRKRVPVIDTDVIAREVVQDATVLRQLAEQFGKTILNPDGSLNRRTLRQMTFANDEHRIRLGELLHPLIFERAAELLSRLEAPYCLLVVPLLYESQHPYPYDRVLVVDVDEEHQRQRASLRDQADSESIQKIMNAQASRQQRLSIANDIIDNNGSIADLVPQVEVLHKKYLALAKQALPGEA